MCHVDPSKFNAGSSVNGGEKAGPKPANEPESAKRKGWKPKVSSSDAPKVSSSDTPRKQLAFNQATSQLQQHKPSESWPLMAETTNDGSAKSSATSEHRGYGYKRVPEPESPNVDWRLSTLSEASARDEKTLVKPASTDNLKDSESVEEDEPEINQAKDAKKESWTSFLKTCLANFTWAITFPINFVLGLMGFGVVSSEAGKSAHATVHGSAGEEITPIGAGLDGGKLYNSDNDDEDFDRRHARVNVGEFQELYTEWKTEVNPDGINNGNDL